MFLLIPLQLDGVLLSGATNRQVLLALYGLTELNVPPVLLLNPLGYPGVVEHSVQLVALDPSVA